MWADGRSSRGGEEVRRGDVAGRWGQAGRRKRRRRRWSRRPVEWE
uniref:Uncharacterized protein n=1 Tax=Arundo donax TaxID=35708 RepID=A0A0A9BCV9_ARUDO